MTIKTLKIGDTVGLQYETGRRTDAAEVVYVGPTCYQLSNGLLYLRSGGGCIQGTLGGHLVPWFGEDATHVSRVIELKHWPHNGRGIGM